MELQTFEDDSDHKQLTVSDYSSIERKKWVLQQYLLGRYPVDIFKEYASTYQLSKASYDKDVLWSNTQLKKQGERDVELIIDTHLAYLKDVYRHCREVGDSGNAIKAMKEIRETLGIGGTKVKSVSLNQTINNNMQMPSMSVSEIRKLLGKEEDSNTVIDISPAE